MACVLTTLAHVKAWLGIPADQTASDDLLERLILSASRFILSYIQRSTICVQDYSELYDGNGKSWMLLKQWPIQSIQSFILPGQTITTLLPSSAMSGLGFKINPLDTPDEGPQRITLWGAIFPLGRDTVNVNYTAGFKQIDETLIYQVGTGPTYTVDLTQTWAGPLEVLDEAGDPMERITGPTGMTGGQYSVTDTGEYYFASVDVGNTVSVVYSYVPADLEQACFEMVAEGMRYKERIGVKSKTLGGQETIVYDNSFINARCERLLMNYRRVAPL